MKTKLKERPFRIGQKVLVVVEDVGANPYIQETVIRAFCKKTRGNEQLFNVRQSRQRGEPKDVVTIIRLIPQSRLRHVGWRGKADLLEIIGEHYQSRANELQRQANVFAVYARDKRQDAQIMRMVKKMK